MECNLTTKYLRFIIQSYGLKIPPCKMYVKDYSYSDEYNLYVVIDKREIEFLRNAKKTKYYITSYKTKTGDNVVVFTSKDFNDVVDKLVNNNIKGLYTDEQLKNLRITERSYPNIYGVIKRTNIGKEYFKNYLIDKFNYNGSWEFLENQEWECATTIDKESFTS